MAELDDRELRALYDAGRPRDGHLDEADWDRLALGEPVPSERRRLAEHIARCPQCSEIQATLELFAEACRGAGLEAPRRASRTAPPLPAWRLGWGLVAATLIAVAFLWPGRERRDAPEISPASDVLRDASSLPRPEASSPLAVLDQAPARFSWTAVGPDWSYHVELLDSRAEPIWRSETTRATSIERPAAVVLAPAATYFWRVVSTPPRGGAAVSSRLVSFEISARSAAPANSGRVPPTSENGAQ